MLLLFLARPLGAQSLEDLRKDPGLTPAKLIKLCSDFEFKFHARLQQPEVFVLTRSGDCDDFAVTADVLLKPRGFGTRLIGIQMPGRAHMVCYVDKEGAYLDYNNRTFLIPKVRCGSDLGDIATKVAKSLHANWTSATEYSYADNGTLQVITTVVKAAPSGGETKSRSYSLF
jgi:hypothetical protein